MSSPMSVVEGSPSSTELVVRSAENDEELMNPEEPYTIEEFFTLVEKRTGCDVYRCRGQCGPGRTGLQGHWSRARLFAHICRVPCQGVDLCTSVPRTLRGHEFSPAQIRTIATRLYVRSLCSDPVLYPVCLTLTQ